MAKKTNEFARNKDLAGQTVSVNGKNITYDENGYATKGTNYSHDLYKGTDMGVKAKSADSVVSSNNRTDYGGSQYDQQFFSDDELKAAADLRNQAASGQATWDAVHEYVENLRSSYGYSGGNDGSQFIVDKDMKSWNEINGLLDDVLTTPGMLNKSNAGKLDSSKTTGVVGISSVYDQRNMSESDRAAIEFYSQLAKEASAKGDRAGVTSAHNAAEAIRAKYGYSGGQYGDEYIPLTQQNAIPGFNKGSGISSYDSQYSSQIDSLLDAILNRQPFSYDHRTDPVYLAYADSYGRLGDRAREDTLGDVAALNGGYASSWATTAASQAQNDYNQQLGDVIPTLYDAAYNRYLNEDSLKRSDLGIVQGIDNTNYDRYRDTVGDYQWQQQFDYNAYRDSVSDSQWDQTFGWNQYVDKWNMSNTEATQKFDQMMSKWQLTGVADNEVAAALGVPVGATTESYYFNKAQLALDQAKAAKGNGSGTPTAEQQEANALAESIVRNAKGLVNQTESYQKGAEYILSAVESANEFYTIGSKAGIPNSVLQEVFDSFYNQALKDSNQPMPTEKDYTYYAALMGQQDDPEAWLTANQWGIPADILEDLRKLLDY